VCSPHDNRKSLKIDKIGEPGHFWHSVSPSLVLDMAGGSGDALGNYLETRASTQISMQPHRETHPRILVLKAIVLGFFGDQGGSRSWNRWGIAMNVFYHLYIQENHTIYVMLFTWYGLFMYMSGGKTSPPFCLGLLVYAVGVVPDLQFATDSFGFYLICRNTIAWELRVLQNGDNPIYLFILWNWILLILTLYRNFKHSAYFEIFIKRIS